MVSDGRHDGPKSARKRVDDWRTLGDSRCIALWSIPFEISRGRIDARRDAELLLDPAPQEIVEPPKLRVALLVSAYPVDDAPGLATVFGDQALGGGFG